MAGRRSLSLLIVVLAASACDPRHDAGWRRERGADAVSSARPAAASSGSRPSALAAASSAAASASAPAAPGSAAEVSTPASSAPRFLPSNPGCAVPPGMPAWSWRRLRRVALDEPAVVFTLDVGARIENLERVLDIFRDERVAVTAFLYTKELVAHPRGKAVVARMVAEAHELANHTASHDDLTKLDEPGVLEELAGVERFAREAAGVPLMPFFREPFLATNDAVDALVKRRCYRSVWFTVDTGDWREGVTAEDIVDRTLFVKGKPREIEPGSIFIFHGSQPENLRALPEIIRNLRARGLGILPLGEALRRERPPAR